MSDANSHQGRRLNHPVRPPFRNTMLSSLWGTSNNLVEINPRLQGNTNSSSHCLSKDAIAWIHATVFGTTMRAANLDAQTFLLPLIQLEAFSNDDECKNALTALWNH